MPRAGLGAVFAIALLVATHPAGASGTPPKVLRAVPRGDAVVVIDGRLDEPIWTTAAPGTDFVERSPSPGAPAPSGHEVRVLYDRDALYVGVRLPLNAEAREQPRALELTRDSTGVFDDDAVSVKLDVRRDQRSTVGFVTNARGTQLDYIALENGQQFRREYDAVWSVRTTVEADAWFAEFRLPVAALGIPDDRKDRILGINVTRDHSLRAATYDWAAMPPEFGAFSALYYGELRGVRELGGGRPLVLLPYALGRFETEGVDGLGDVGQLWEGRVGGDIQLRLLEDLWSELTIYPDFAQVDLDDPVVNFDRFPLFFPERRPFFLTGLQVFDFGVPGVSQLFFSRRIGLDEDAEEIPVLGGVKAYGTVGSWQVGLFQVFTGRERDEEASTFSIARVRRNFGETAHVGILGTLVGSLAPFEDRAVPFAPRGSIGVDGSLRLAERRLELTGFWAYSHNSLPGEEAERGHSARARAAWRGELLQPSIAVLLVERDFDPAVGFVRRSGIVQVDTELLYVKRPSPREDLRFTLSVYGQTLRASDRDENLGQSAGIYSDLKWRSGWFINGEVEYVEDVVEEAFDLFDRQRIEAGRYRGVRMTTSVSSPTVRNPFFSVAYAADTAFFGGLRHGPVIGSTVRLGPHVRLSSDANLSFTELDDGFSTEALTLNTQLTLAPSTRLQGDFIFQLDTIEEAATGLFRVRWRYFSGSDLFFVSRYQRDYGDPRLQRFDLTVKVQHRFDLLL